MKGTVIAFFTVYYMMAMLAACSASSHEAIIGNTKAQRKHTTDVMRKYTVGASEDMKRYEPK